MWPAREIRSVLLRPACLVGVGYGLVLFLLLMTHNWDPLFFATLGPEWARHDPAGVKRADGMIFHAIASDPFGSAVRFGNYRMERILYPMLARSLSLGRPVLIPWALVLINWAGIILGTELVYQLLRRAGSPSWMALAYGAWGGLGGAHRLLDRSARDLVAAERPNLARLRGVFLRDLGPRNSVLAGCALSAVGGEPQGAVSLVARRHRRGRLARLGAHRSPSVPRAGRPSADAISPTRVLVRPPPGYPSRLSW